MVIAAAFGYRIQLARCGRIVGERKERHVGGG